MFHYLKSRIKHYVSVYIGFIETSFSEAMNFRLHFVLLIIMDLFFYCSALGSVGIIYNHVELIGTWNSDQLLFFVSFMLAINQLTMSFVSESYWRFPFLIRSGELDFYLLKPINPIFSVFFRYVRPGSMMNIVFTSGALIYFGLRVDLSPIAWFMLPVLVLMGFVLQNSIELVITCSMFWMLEGTGINFVRMEFQQLARWPDFIYNSVIKRLLTILLPILLIGSAPTRFLFNFADWLPLIGMTVAIVGSWALMKVIWNIGLNTYESASS